MTEAEHDDQALDTLSNLTAPCQCPFRCLGKAFECLRECTKQDNAGGGSLVGNIIGFLTDAPDTDAPLLPRRLGTSQPPPQLRM